jgi:hypothetical protein
MTAIVATLKSVWTRLAGPESLPGMAELGPNQSKEAGLAHRAGARF